MDGLREVLDGRHGELRLTACTETGERMPEVAYINVEPEEWDDIGGETDPVDGGTLPAAFVYEHSQEMLKRSMATIQAQSMMSLQICQSMTTGMVQMNKNTADVFTALSKILKVTSGVDVPERPEPVSVDVEDLAEKLDATIKEASKKQSPPAWMPLVSIAMQGAQGSAKAFAAPRPSHSTWAQRY